MPECTSNVAGEDYADFIYRHNNVSPEQIRADVGTPCVDYINSQFAVVYVPLADLLPLTIERFSYNSIPNLYTTLDTTSMDASGILSTLKQPTLNARGQGTLIGFIDTGIDYTNPVFQSPDGTTRILDIWDQTIQGSPFTLDDSTARHRFSYGAHYTAEQINEALSSSEPFSIVPSTDTNGHGTFIAGIAAGSAVPSQDFTGAAPECRLAAVRLKPAKQYLRDFYLIPETALAFQENDIMMGIVFLLLLAGRYRMPLTICLGLGTNQGSHDGVSPLGRLLGSLDTYLGVAAVCAAGNEVGLRHHFLGQMTQTTEFQEVEVRVAPEETGFSAELWAMPPEQYTVGFVSPTGEVIQRIPIIQGNETLVSFTLEQTVITVNYRVSPEESQSQLVLIRFQAPTAGIWKIRVYSSIFINGQYHIWLPIDGFIAPDTVFLNANPYTTITEPANASFPITTSTYNHLNNSLYIHSGRGFTRSGSIKPDITAPGVDVYGPGLPPARASSPTEFPTTRRTGSSIAAAHTAGAVADILSWAVTEGHDSYISNERIKSMLIRGAKRNPDYTYPSREWGYGTLDLYQTFLSLRE